MLVLRLAFRNAARNVVRTALTAGIVFFGTALLTVALSWMNGIFGQLLGSSASSAGHVRVVTPGYVSREQLFPLYENIPDSAAVAASLLEVPGVVATYPRILTGVTITAGEEIGEVFGLVSGAPVKWYEERLRLGDDLVDGRLQAEGADGEIVLGATIAQRIDAKVGMEVVLIGQTQDGAMSPLKGTVVGVVSAGNALIDQGVFLPLGPVQYMADIGAGATEILVYGEDRDDAGDLAEAIDAAAPFDAWAVEAWSSREPWGSMIAITDVVRGMLQAVIVFITALGVWNTMMMSVLERTGEIGVMRAMGLSRLGAVALFVVEAVTIAVTGGLVGITVGGLGGLYLEKYGVELGAELTKNLDAAIPFTARLFADVSPEVLATSFGLGLAMAFIGSAAPALRAASIQPVEAMRERR
ncbi:MAG: ABC transporter permease [Deltaproteobacteria bacterium]|nr:ABC transporter permease [Deltaproteobacteria bacterium]